MVQTAKPTSDAEKDDLKRLHELGYARNSGGR